MAVYKTYTSVQAYMLEEKIINDDENSNNIARYGFKCFLNAYYTNAIIPEVYFCNLMENLSFDEWELDFIAETALKNLIVSYLCI